MRLYSQGYKVLWAPNISTINEKDNWQRAINRQIDWAREKEREGRTCRPANKQLRVETQVGIHVAPSTELTPLTQFPASSTANTTTKTMDMQEAKKLPVQKEEAELLPLLLAARWRCCCCCLLDCCCCCCCCGDLFAVVAAAMMSVILGFTATRRIRNLNVILYVRFAVRCCCCCYLKYKIEKRKIETS